MSVSATEAFVLKPYPTPTIERDEKEAEAFGQRFTLQLNTPRSK